MRVLFGPDPIEFANQPPQWICTVCEKRERWGPDWRYYGSYLDEDAGELPFVVCSDDCFSSGAAKALIRQTKQLARWRMGPGGAVRQKRRKAV